MNRKSIIAMALLSSISLPVKAVPILAPTTCQALFQTSAAQRKSEIADAVQEALVPPPGGKPLPLHTRQDIRDCAIQAIEAARTQALGLCIAGDDPTEEFAAAVDSAVAACVAASAVSSKDARDQFGKILQGALAPTPS